MNRGRWQEAREYFTQALAIERSAEALEGLGWALFWLDDPQKSFDVREDAYRLFLQRGETRRAARLATNLALDHADFNGVVVTMGWLQRARRLLEGLEAGPEHGWLCLWEGHFARAYENDPGKARRLAEEAYAIGRDHGVTDLELLAIALEGLVLVTEGAVPEGMRKLDEATAAALAGEMSDVDSVAVTCCLLAHACDRVRDYDRAAQWADRVRRFSERWSLGSMFALCRVQYAGMLVGVGRWDEAEREVELATRELQAGRPKLVFEATVQLGELRRRQGRREEASAIFRQHDNLTESMLGLAAIAADDGDWDAVERFIARFRRRPLAEKWVDRASALLLLIEALAERGRLDQSGGPLHELQSVAERIGTESVSAIACEAEGIVASASGDHEGARNAFERSVTLFDRASAPFEAARARMRLAESLARLDQHEFAIQESKAACEIFERLGAEDQLRRGRALLTKLSPASSSEGETRPLTRRELEVLRLVARGMSDKEVARELGLSEHTIHRHVSNILTKLDLPSRAAAVAQVARMGILD